MDVRLAFGGLGSVSYFQKTRRNTTSPGRHGTLVYEESRVKVMIMTSLKEAWIPNWMLNMDVIEEDEQSSVP
ncbi:hypothetical protein SHVI106290_07135 [Shewanella violacea]